MKNIWPTKKLGDICEVLNGFAFKSNKYVDDGVRIIRITNVQHGYIEDNDPKFYPIDECERLNQYMLKEQDLLMSLTGNVGRVGLLDNKFLPAALNQRVACLRVKDKDIELKYLFHHLNSELFETRCIQSAKGIAQKNMSTEWLKEYNIPIPSLPEQAQIVEELDQLSNIIKKKRQQLSELDNLAQSIFYDMFGDPVTNEKGWEVKKLGEVSNIVGGSTPKTNVEEYWKGEHFWVTPAELKGCRYIERTERCISDEAIIKTNLTLLPVGTVLLSSRAPIGKVCITRSQMYCNQGFKNVICLESLNNEYVCQFLMIQKDFLQSLGTGATFKEISKKVTENINIPLPPLQLQQLFAQKIEAIEKEKELIKQSIKETEELFNSRMDYYFG